MEIDSSTPFELQSTPNINVILLSRWRRKNCVPETAERVAVRVNSKVVGIRRSRGRMEPASSDECHPPHHTAPNHHMAGRFAAALTAIDENDLVR